MGPPTPLDPDYERRTRDSFAAQAAMKLLGARMTRVAPGEVEIELPFRADLTQQHGFFHAGILATVADSAGGYAAFTLFPKGAEVLTVEYKVNLLAPAVGARALARGRVLRSGATLTVSEITVDVEGDRGTKTCLHGLQTLIRRDPDALRGPRA